MLCSPIEVHRLSREYIAFVFKVREQAKQSTSFLVACLASTLKMEAAYYSETLVNLFLITGVTAKRGLLFNIKLLN
jgi:hypothetical protein